jgi:hypothetical protein
VTPSQIEIGHLLSSLESRDLNRISRPKHLTPIHPWLGHLPSSEGHRVTPTPKRWRPVYYNPGHLPTFSKPRGQPLAPGVEKPEPVHISPGHLPSLVNLRGHPVSPEFKDLTTVHSIPSHLPSSSGLRSLIETSRTGCHPPGHIHLPSIPEDICICEELGQQVKNLSLTKLA